MGTPYSPPYMYSPGGDRIIDIIMRRGDTQAAHALRSGDIWGGAARELGGIIGQYAAEKKAKQEQERRNAAIWDAINAPESADPKVLYKSLFQIAGPEVAQEYTEGVVNLQQLSDKAEAANLERAQKVAGWMANAPPDLFAKGWPVARERLAPIASQLGAELPEQPTPELQQWLGQVAGQKTGELLKLAPGEIAVDASGKQVAAGTPKPVAAPEPRVVGRSLVGPDGKVIYRDPESSAADKPKMYEVDVPGPNGTVIKKLVSEAELRGGVTTAPKTTGQKPVLGAERTALAFYNRAKDATDDITTLEDRIASRSAVSQEWNTSGVVPNRFKSQDQQLYEQNQRTFTEARLRKESGAAIPESEYENDRRTYWAVPGDSKKTVEQKRQRRKTVLEGLAYSAGRAYEEFYGEPFQRSTATADESKGDGSTDKTKKVGRFSVEVE